MPPTQISPLSLHDALPIFDFPIGPGGAARTLWPGRTSAASAQAISTRCERSRALIACAEAALDRKSTRLNSSHVSTSYAVFCLKKKKRHDCRRQRQEDRLF